MNDASTDLTDPPNFQHWITQTIRIADIDAGSHITNAGLAAYVKSNRVGRLRSATFDRALGERWVMAYLKINFRADATPPRQVGVGIRPVAIGTKSVARGAGLFKDDACIPTAQSIRVFLNGANTVPVP